MADWDTPDLPDLWQDFLDLLKARDFDAISLGHGTITNPMTGMIRWVRATDKFQEYDGAVWQDQVLSVAGGGTGANSASGARTALGLGTIATQDANNVTITGGTIANLASLGVNGDLTLVGVLITGSGSVQLTHANGKIQAISSTYFQSLDGSALTNLTPANIASGTLPALNGSNLTNLNASNLSTGTVNVARLGSGSVGAGLKFLADNNTWKFAGGMKEIVHNDFSFGSGEFTRQFIIPWLGTAPTDENTWELKFRDSRAVWEHAGNGGGVTLTWVLDDGDHVTITRIYQAGATGTITAQAYQYTAFHHQITG